VKPGATGPGRCQCAINTSVGANRSDCSKCFLFRVFRCRC
jgi:hypothetical protein